MKNSNNVKVYFSFLNRKNELKTVHFLIDKQSYKVLKQFPKEERDKYMLEEYRLFCKEQKHKRKTQSINSFFDKDGELMIESNDEGLSDLSYQEELVERMLLLYLMLKEL